MNFGAHQLLRACRPSSIRSFTNSVIGVPAPFVYTAAAASRHARSLTTTTTTTTTTTPPPPPPASTTSSENAPASTSTPTASPSSSSAPPPQPPTTTPRQHTNKPTPTKSTPLPPQTSRKYGTVISVGHMDKVVRVQFLSLQFDKHVKADFPDRKVFLVADPNNSLRQGDVIEFWSGWRSSRNVRHVVERIMTPFGTPVSERPPVMGLEERVAHRMQKRVEKRERKEKAAAEKGKVSYKGRGEVVIGENGMRVGKLKLKIRDRMERERKRVEALKEEGSAEKKTEVEEEIVDKAT